MSSDYILRLIEELGRVVAGIVAMRQRGELSEADQALDEALTRLVGFGTKVADELPSDQLIQMIRLADFSGRDGRVDTDRLVALGALLQESGELAAARQDAALTDSRRLKALRVLMQASMQERAISNQVRDAVDALTAHLADYEFPFGLKERLWLHYERLGHWSRAEDWMFELLDDEQSGPGAIAAGIAFYERLGRRTDAELEGGGLSREEVAAGLEQLRARVAESDEDEDDNDNENEDEDEEAE